MLEKEQIFFSYSRTDSAFALKLASELREAGADIWIDQLDIQPGLRWDAEIEKALKGSASMFVILSAKAVVSDNVLDEISYALEQGKRLIPIVIGDCEIPYRLKRLQHVDFAKDYDQGFQNLLRVLNLPVAAKATEAEKPPRKEPLANTNPTQNTKEPVYSPQDKIFPADQQVNYADRTDIKEKTKSRKKIIWLAILLLLVLAGVAGVYIFSSMERNKKDSLLKLLDDFDRYYKSKDYKMAINTADKIVPAVGWEKFGYMDRGMAKIMMGVLQNKDAAVVKEGINDIEISETRYGANFLNCNYHKAIAYHFLGDPGAVLKNINLVIQNSARDSVSYGEHEEFGAYFLRGMAYQQLNQNDKACTDFKNGMEIKDENARKGFAKYCEPVKPKDKITKETTDAAITKDKGNAEVVARVDVNSSPSNVVNEVFRAARTGDFSNLSKLCYPDPEESDGDVKRICAVIRSAAVEKKSFRDAFSKGRIVGRVVIDKRSGQERESAQVPIKFGLNGSQDETFNLIKIGGKWYLESF